MEEGEAIGLEKGQRNLDLAQIDTIQAMLSKGCDWAFIEDITHLNESAYLTLKAKYPPT